MAHIWAWFGELSSARGSSGFSGPNPISYEAILAWSLLTGTVVRPSEVRAIVEVDQAWLAHLAKHAAPPSAPPSRTRRGRP